MIQRFQGEANKANLIDALRRQQAVLNNDRVARLLADVAVLDMFEPPPGKDVLIRQDASDSDIYFILAGRVSIAVNGREVAIREAHEHVGEMAMIDSSAPRCATVTALQQTVVAKVAENQFTPIAEKYSYLWRQLALELGNRLRERSKLVTPPNPRPVLFIGSSKESLTPARQIQELFSHDDVVPRMWTEGFRPSATSIENLEREKKGADFAILVLAADDLVESRGTEREAPRDNVIWERGFFTGGLGRGRVFVVKPRGLDLKVPSDWGGITLLDYDPAGTLDDLSSRLGPAVNAIRREIDRLKVK